MSESQHVRSWEDISADFLTEVLLKKNFQGKVLSITSESIGTGQVGENIRFNLEIEGDMPKSIVGKFPAIDETSRQTGIQLLNYQREVFFYNNLQSETTITTPNIFLCDIDPMTHDFIILMEDLAPGTPGDQIAGCGVSEAELALTQLAHLHGSMWEKTNLADDNIVSRGGKDQTPTGELYKALAPGFIERYRDALASTEKNAISDYELVPSQRAPPTKIDINNANVRVYAKLPGMYPGAAGKIASNGPYKSVSEIYAFMNEKEKAATKKYESRLITLEQSAMYVIDRLNNGLYR